MYVMCPYRVIPSRIFGIMKKVWENQNNEEGLLKKKRGKEHLIKLQRVLL